MVIVIAFLTCPNKREANTIAQALLEKRLVACVKQFPITSQFLWQDIIENSHEILLIMETIDTYFDTIEQEIKQLHSYDTFVLTAIAVHNISKAASKWIKETLQSSKKIKCY